MSRRQHPLIWIAALLAIAIGTWWQQRDRPEYGNRAEDAEPRASAPAPSQKIDEPSQKIDEVVRDAEERAELQKTLDLIARGGPFPYRNDGSVFANRERRLPQHERGYYREYTVVTPRAQNRGARRVVRGNGGETYYTRDHYRTFVRID
ncbi:MAG TPA: ribonuclease domain-containing protein [Thermoanaerobaculia bacterium]|nr:ribonuclease domain-containing protein [Thermoanaerobaculia bacterium]